MLRFFDSPPQPGKEAASIERRDVRKADATGPSAV